jgi:hypothetical protein
LIRFGAALEAHGLSNKRALCIRNSGDGHQLALKAAEAKEERP